MCRRRRHASSSRFRPRLSISIIRLCVRDRRIPLLRIDIIYLFFLSINSPLDNDDALTSPPRYDGRRRLNGVHVTDRGAAAEKPARRFAIGSASTCGRRLRVVFFRFTRVAATDPCPVFLRI